VVLSQSRTHFCIPASNVMLENPSTHTPPTNRNGH